MWEPLANHRSLKWVLKWPEKALRVPKKIKKNAKKGQNRPNKSKSEKMKI